uniref:Uncharacterized protein n=1 Tax=uncultured marine group II/III euryarchaeote KM3_109_G01 TaxID=1457850 RepID=A0A075G5T0_9EURY|nr:hypothetical protein [uncultured marine group II/III euryarchaeote KM3_109_G01]
MADDVELQQEGARTLHLRQLRKQWQVLLLQVVASIALLWLLLQATSAFGSCAPDHTLENGESAWCPAYDHTLSLNAMERGLASATGDADYSMPLPDWLTGAGSDGQAKYFAPLFLMLLLAGGWATLGFQPPQRRRKIYLGVLLGLILFLCGIMLLTWLWGMLSSFDLYWPFGHDAGSSLNHVEHLVWPLTVFAQMLILLLYFSPILLGLAGIWGLSRRLVGWSLGLFLVYFGLYALLSYEGITSGVGGAGINLGLDPMPTQLSGSMILAGLVDEVAFPLMLIALLMLIYTESAFAVVRMLEYAFRLPESCKKDPEYVRQFDNLVHGHLMHTAALMLLTTLVTMFALLFDDLILVVVNIFQSGQWSGQVQESLELQLTYGLVISALLFLVFVAGLRYILPWQRIMGLIESTIPKFRREA